MEQHPQQPLDLSEDRADYDYEDDRRPYEYASRWARLGAAIVDALITGAVNFAILIPLGFIDFDDPEKMEQLSVAIPSALIGMGVYLALHSYLLAKNGQTIGKKLLNIKIVRTSGEKISYGRIVGLRLLPIWIIANIPLIGGIIALADVLLIFREERNCLHDDIADSRVIVA